MNRWMEAKSRLARRLKTHDAVVIGLGSMIGAGIFAAIGPAAAAAGSGLLLAVLLAGAVAFLNAVTMAQLASVYPESGGTYVYGGKLLGPFWGFLAGWGFVIGKLASCTAMALTFAFYASPEYAKPLAVAAVLLLTFVNSRGVKKTAGLTKLIVVLVLASLTAVVFSALAGGAVQTERIAAGNEVSWSGLLQAAGMMFFAFAGYARVATLGEEVIEPEKNIPRAILIALGLTLMVYLTVVTSSLLSVGADSLAFSKTPLVLAVESGRFSFLSPVVRIGACLASLGVLLSLLAGISRTAFAMADNRDLPKVLSVVHPVYRVPHRAEWTVGTIVAAVVGFADLRTSIGFSSFAILTYYAIANVCAFVLPHEKRRWPRWMPVLGLFSCLAVAASLPGNSVIGGLILFVLGSVFYLAAHRMKKAS